jgi:hypothetical protein
MELTETNESPPGEQQQQDDEVGPLLEEERNHPSEDSPEQTQFQQGPVSLAFSRSTPWIARVLLPLCLLTTHALFYYGQTAPMWRLRIFAHIDAWANATDVTARRAFDIIGEQYDIPFRYDEDKDVQTFTYSYAIEHLWNAKDLPGKALPRLAAILLIVFSGIWPHLKLVWLNVTWFFAIQPERRSTTLRWLSTLGKWSLADVLVVCVMVGVLHLDWIVEPADIKEGLITDLPQMLAIVQSQYDANALCDKFLKMECAVQKSVSKNHIKCKLCQGLINEAYTRPEWARSTGASILNGVETSGGGLATMRVVGMSGIYVFCLAVIISILLSLIVDIFDHRAKHEVRKQEQRAIGQRRLQRVQQQLQLQTVEEEDSLHTPLLGSDTTTASPLEVDLGSEDDSPPSTPTHIFSWNILVLTFLTTVLVFLAVDINTMDRQVYGAGPMLLHDILGVNWERPYSLRSLMWTTGAAGDWDYLLMGTFALFCVLGPAVRSVLLVVATLLDRCFHLPISPLMTLINFIGAFCSWEVFAIAIVMVQMLMPSITNTIVNDPVCASISEDGSCLQVQFNVLPVAFSTIVIGGFLLALTSWVSVRKGSTSTDRVPPATMTTLMNHHPGVVSRVMVANHDYQRIGERTSETNNDDVVADDGGLQQHSQQEQLVFETNQV